MEIFNYIPCRLTPQLSLQPSSSLPPPLTLPYSQNSIAKNLSPSCFFCQPLNIKLYKQDFIFKSNISSAPLHRPTPLHLSHPPPSTPPYNMEMRSNSSCSNPSHWYKRIAPQSTSLIGDCYTNGNTPFCVSYVLQNQKTFVCL